MFLNLWKPKGLSFLYTNFVSTVDSIFVINGSRWRGLNTGTETWKNIWPMFSSFDAIIPKIPQIFNEDIFSLKVHLILPFWFVRNVDAFNSRNKFRFFNELKPANIQWHCPLLNVLYFYCFFLLLVLVYSLRGFDAFFFFLTG